MMKLSFANRSIVLDVNPKSVSFSYDLNTSSIETKAGKVVQILSTKVSDMQVQSSIGASRGYENEAFERYFNLVSFCKDLMSYQASTNNPATFTFDKLNYDLKVFLKSQTFTDNFQQVSYPYSLMFHVDEDISGIATSNAMSSVFSKIKNGVGFVPGSAGWHGGTV